MTSAPPAIPADRAMWPASRPITSSTMTRAWLAAVGCRRSSASVATATAVSKPTEVSVSPTSLSMVFGMPTRFSPPCWASLRRIAKLPSPPMPIRASSPSSRQPADDLLRPVLDRAVGHRKGERVAAVGGAQDGATLAHDGAGELFGVQHFVLQGPAEQAHRAFLDADDGPAKLRRPGGRGADHRIEAGAVAAAGQDADTLFACHVGRSRSSEDRGGAALGLPDRGRGATAPARTCFAG